MEQNLIFLHILLFIVASVFYIVLKSNLLSSCRELCGDDKVNMVHRSNQTIYPYEIII